MPTYEYECQDCGHRFEVIQRITEDPISTCEKCTGKVRKLLFPVGILFKGSGFHVNDYRKPEAGKNGGASEAKPAAKSEASAEKV